jgi:3-methyladenine DNA glycosylase Tag
VGKLVPGGAQAGLSWRNILTKRANFLVAVQRLNPGITARRSGAPRRKYPIQFQLIR